MIIEVLVESQPPSLSTTPAKEPERPGISLLDFGKGKLGHRIGIVGMEIVLKTAFADIQEKNSPHTSIVKLYQLFAAQLPSFISSESKLAALEAIKSKDSDISEAGTNVFTLLHIPVILSAAEPYLTGYSSEDQADLIQAGITNLLSGIPRFTGADPDKITTDDSHRISNSARSLVVTGIVQEIADKKNLPVEWVRNNLHTRAAGLIDAAFTSHPYGLTREQITEAAEGISQATGTSKESVACVLEERNSLLSMPEPMDEEYLVDAALRPAITSAVMQALQQLGNRLATIMEARRIDDCTQEQAGKRLGLKGYSQVWKLESKAFRLLRHPSRSRPLQPYLYPEDGEIHQPRQPQPDYEFINMSALARKYSKPKETVVTQEPAINTRNAVVTHDIRESQEPQPDNIIPEVRRIVRPRQIVSIWHDEGHIVYLKTGIPIYATLARVRKQRQSFSILGTDEQTRLKAEFESSNGSAESTRLYRDFLRSEILGKQIRESINPTS